MPAVHSRYIDVTRDLIDENGHVGNLRYLQWMQEIAVEHSAVQGWPMKRYFRAGASWVVRSHFIEYLRPAVEGDRLGVHTWVQSMARDRSPRRYLIRREADGAVVARAETLWVFVDHRTGRAQAIPEELGQAFELVPTDAEALDRLDAGIAQPQRPRGADAT